MKFLIILLVFSFLGAAYAADSQEYLPPLQQLKSGVALVDVICTEDKVPAYKYNAQRVACVSLETESQLVARGWALLRLHMYDDDPSRALCERYEGNWLADHRECEYISTQQCSLMGGTYSECESVCRHDPDAEICTLQCVSVCTVQNHFPEFAISYSREGGIAGITETISIDTQDHLIKISGFDEKTLGPISTEDMQLLWDVIAENQFFELEKTAYPPVPGSADYFTYTLDIVNPAKRNTISWTDTSKEFPIELIIISQEINKQVEAWTSKQEAQESQIPETLPDMDIGLSIQPEFQNDQRSLIFTGHGWRGFHVVTIHITNDKGYFYELKTKTAQSGDLFMPWLVPDDLTAGWYHIRAFTGEGQFESFEIDIPIASPESTFPKET